MKDFELIDWKKYNKPPFYQQWLCEGDPLKLAAFGDQNLGDIVLQILKLKDQWNLGNAGGALLDRIGKLLREARNGNNDELYRKYIRLRTLLNTADGSLNNIIQIMKFIYETEVVHIVQDYPAGLVIEHQGELTPGLDFNAIIKQVIPAGVAYSTKELFDFIEELASSDKQLIQVRHNPKEEFEGRIYRNRRVRRDGHTILPTELKRAYHNGTNWRNGSTRHNGQYETGAASYIKLPLIRESGYLEQAFFGLGTAMKDFQPSQLFRNGSIRRKVRAKRNGEFRHNGGTNRMPFTRHNGRSPYSINDTISVFDLKQPTAEDFPSAENPLVNLTLYDAEQFRKPYNRDGAYRHNSAIFHSGWALDFLALVQTLLFGDAAAGSVYHNKTVTRSGGVNHGGTGNVFAYEKQALSIGLPVTEAMPADENHILGIENDSGELVSRFCQHNRSFARDGTFMRGSRINDRLSLKTAISPALTDTQSGRLMRNGSITRTGTEYHQGRRAAYDTFSAGIRYHHFHNGGYVRNNGIQHNAGVLISLKDIA